MYYEVEYLANEKMKRLYFSRRLDSKSLNFTLYILVICITKSENVTAQRYASSFSHKIRQKSFKISFLKIYLDLDR